MGKLAGKIALITGGNSGIGAGCSKLFALEGAQVIIAARNKEKALAVVNEIKNNKGKAEYFICDVTSQEEINGLKDYIEDKYGKLDILINNAGVFITSSFYDINDTDWKNTLDTNVTACLHFTKTFMPLLEKSHGVILNNASIAGLGSYVKKGSSFMYATAKAAVIQFTKYCAINFAGTVRVNCVCPGIIDTPIFKNRDFSRFDGVIPMGRMGKPEDVAKAALFLCSSDSDYITGAVLPVDGGVALN